MQKICEQCSAPFEITPDDLQFYETVAPTFGGKSFSIPEPVHCPFCRMQIRLTQRNERNLYHRKCSRTGKQIISCYVPDRPFPVYENDEWYGDAWDAREYGVAFDFTRPFFEQFAELRSRVPRLARILEKPYENSDYCNTASQLRNCYLLFSSNQDEDCYYGLWINQCNDCIDNLNLERCELHYECVSCRECYDLRYSRDCINCRNSFFLRDCQGCSDCFGCTNQVNKQYMVFNIQKTREEYEEFLKTVRTGSAKEMKNAREQIEKRLSDPIVKEFHGANLQNSTGDYLRNCKNARECFESNDLEDCAYCHCVQKGRNCQDYSHWGHNADLMYSCQACGYDVYHLLFCNLCWSNCSELLYCDHCFSAKHSFGCVGLRQQEYCILNKQYTKEEYEVLVPKIIEHMKKTGEWGTFFPPAISIFAYNETSAHDHAPLKKEEVLRRGWLWRDEDQEEQYLGPDYSIADLIDQVPDDICKEILTCEATGKPYKVIPQELKFYREKNIPIPHLCPDERHRRRFLLRNPRRLWKRTCQKCGTQIQTSFAPDRHETVYCEQCYLSSMY